MCHCLSMQQMDFNFKAVHIYIWRTLNRSTHTWQEWSTKHRLQSLCRAFAFLNTGCHRRSWLHFVWLQQQKTQIQSCIADNHPKIMFGVCRWATNNLSLPCVFAGQQKSTCMFQLTGQQDRPTLSGQNYKNTIWTVFLNKPELLQKIFHTPSREVSPKEHRFSGSYPITCFKKRPHQWT